MSIIELNRPVSFYLLKDGEYIKLNISGEGIKDSQSYPEMKINYRSGARILKNVTFTKIYTPKFAGPDGEIDQELIYDVTWEDEEWEES